MNRNDKQIEHYRYNSKKGRIGKGSYATVYKGFDTKSNQNVAIKQIYKADLQSADNEEHLLNEINMLKRIKNPNIIEILDVLQTKEHYYIILEYCNIGDLDSLLKQKDTIKLDDHITFLQDILNAFTTLIRCGIAHRDLKPANILVHQEGKRRIFKLADFGYAKTICNYNAQILKSNLGTPAYMSPQLLKEEQYTTKSDIWSFGIMLYQIIYNTLPWVGKSEYDLIQKIVNIPIAFPQTPKVSTVCQDLIINCLQVNEDKRLNWDDLFRHPYVSHYFGKVDIQQNNSLKQMHTLTQSLRQKIGSEEKMDQFLIKLKLKNNQWELNNEEFSMLIQLINENESISNNDIQCLFQECQIDGKVCYKQFKNCIFNGDPKRVKIVRHLSNSNIKILSNLDVALTQHNIRELFEQFATTKQDTLERHQFTKMIKMLANTNQLTNQNIKEIIDFFDDNGDGMIQFSEFNNVLRYVQQIDRNKNSDNSLDTITELDEMSFIQDHSNFKNVNQKFERRSDQKISLCECVSF
ncbi:unnamed protein product (macronuclear) [Paramecium tetraurelia]|uniref:Protein kinase domain-containing protein n=1 Tax=Paramecium tetraurelia TaxID=5888 RepID=A0C9U0_PARTE|nr:uncharacterized protein GSPATT00006864001 [Paramecium tetraurelia]CAK67557.1 unnamed protein product [Paramecium tetraurelia]|eukprot:XP_001434954.1 hypothetical protein (macronuclear) [Paramecium tetraurelia strain d4-2]